MNEQRIVAIHQPHYFPWIGYLDKIAKSDLFIILDEVQFEKGSQMNRNRVIDNCGEIRYITISAETKNHLDSKYNSICTKDNKIWKERQINALTNYYRGAQYKDETMKIIDDFFDNDYFTLCEWTCESIKLCMKLLDIQTPLVYQSSVSYDRQSKKSDLVLELCKAKNATCYLSGRGASVAYLDREAFENTNIDICFQDFVHPTYHQFGTNNFIPGVSVLDMFFNCGVKQSKDIFWDEVKRTSCITKY